MGNIAAMTRRTRNAWAFSPFKGDILWHNILFLVHLSLVCVAFIFQLNHLEADRADQNSPFQGSRFGCLMHAKVQMAAFTLIQMSSNNRKIAQVLFFLSNQTVKCEHTPILYQLDSFGTYSALYFHCNTNFSIALNCQQCTAFLAVANVSIAL